MKHIRLGFCASQQLYVGFRGAQDEDYILGSYVESRFGQCLTDGADYHRLETRQTCYGHLLILCL